MQIGQYDKTMRTNWVIAITGHYGAGRSTVARYLHEHHRYEIISLSGFLREELEQGASIEELQAAGDRLREEHGFEVLAEKALKSMGDDSKAKYVVDGIKNPEEARLLERKCSNTYLLGIQAAKETLGERTEATLGQDPTKFEEIHRKDDRETDRWGIRIDHGQRVADCLGLADALIWNDRPIFPGPDNNDKGSLGELKTKVDRLVELIESPYRSLPQIEETRMCQAYVVARTSSCLKRNVGAVIVNEDQRIIAEGCNDVPRGLDPCSEKYGRCYREILREEELKRYKPLMVCPECGGDLELTDDNADLACASCGERIAHRLPRRANLDYCRALHAEESAILQASRHGGVGVEGGYIFTTTFPCALCAKKIVASGIRTVIFTEPYDVAEALTVLREGDIEVLAFDGITYRAYNRVYKGRETNARPTTT